MFDFKIIFLNKIQRLFLVILFLLISSLMSARSFYHKTNLSLLLISGDIGNFVSMINEKSDLKEYEQAILDAIDMDKKYPFNNFYHADEMIQRLKNVLNYRITNIKNDCTYDPCALDTINLWIIGILISVIANYGFYKFVYKPEEDKQKIIENCLKKMNITIKSKQYSDYLPQFHNDYFNPRDKILKFHNKSYTQDEWSQIEIYRQDYEKGLNQSYKNFEVCLILGVFVLVSVCGTFQAIQDCLKTIGPQDYKKSLIKYEALLLYVENLKF